MSSKFPIVPGVTVKAGFAGPLSVTVEALVEGEVAASGSLMLIDRGHEWRATFGLSLSPETTDAIVPAALIRWAEVEAQTIVQRARAPFARAGLGGKPVSLVFCLDNPPADAATTEALAAAGLVLTVAEDEMTRLTRDAPVRALPPGMEFRRWDESAAPLFHHAYFESFRTRPGFPNWDEPRWRSSFASDEAFRPDLSVVVLDGPEPAAFAVLWVEDETGWVTQMGVRPEWRGKGIGEAILSYALTAFAAEGIERAALEVATNNPVAQALYERMGFTVSASHRSWRKTL